MFEKPNFSHPVQRWASQVVDEIYENKPFLGLIILRQIAQFFQSARRVPQRKDPSTRGRLHPTLLPRRRVDGRCGSPVLKHQLWVLVEFRIYV